MKVQLPPCPRGEISIAGFLGGIWGINRLIGLPRGAIQNSLPSIISCGGIVLQYQTVDYKFSPDFLKEVHHIKPWITYRSILWAWVVAIALVELCHLYLMQMWWFWPLYLPALFLIASRQGALLNIVHEGSHYLITKNKPLNDWISKWLCAVPVGIDLEGFRHGHRMHHVHTGAAGDPPSDTEKYKHTKILHPRMLLLFLKDLAGVTALQVFFAYKTKQFDREEMEKDGRGKFIAKFGSLAIVQTLILGVLFQFDVVHYVLLWIVPAATAHMVLMRIRGIAEHGLPRQLCAEIKVGREGSNLTRSFLTSTRSYRVPLLKSLERFLIGSVNINYHHEHHALPGVPFYHLPKVHPVVSSQLKAQNPELYEVVYEKGYFTAFGAGYKRYQSC